MSLKKYMILDLVILSVIGCIIEAVGIFAFNKMLTARIIASAISLLMMMISITRWGWKGLLIAPVLAAATLISGRFFNPHETFKDLYDWRLYISIVLSLLSLSVNMIWFKYIDYKKTFKNWKYILILCVIDILTSQLVLTLAYWAFAQEFGLLGFLAWNSCSFILLIVGTFILKNQNVLVNVKESLLEKRKQQEDDSNFRMNLPEEDNNEIKDIDEIEEEKGDYNDGEGCRPKSS